MFNSYFFLFGFLPVVVVFFFVLGRSSQRWASAWLTAASVFFYGWWNPAYLGLLLASMNAVTYRFIEKSDTKSDGSKSADKAKEEDSKKG